MTPSLAEIAYNAYCEKQKWLSFRGEPLPKWDDVKEEIKEAWRASTDAVFKVVAYRYGLQTYIGTN